VVVSGTDRIVDEKTIDGPSTRDPEPQIQGSDSFLLLKACVTFVVVHRDYLHECDWTTIRFTAWTFLFWPRWCNKIDLGRVVALALLLGACTEEIWVPDRPGTLGHAPRFERRAGITAQMELTKRNHKLAVIMSSHHSKRNDRKPGPVPKCTRSSSPVTAGWTCLKRKGVGGDTAKACPPPFLLLVTDRLR
jgi:hypothetical protein